MDNVYRAYYKSAMGMIEITGTEEGILSVDFMDEEIDSREIPPCLMECYTQLDEYFKGIRRDFSLKLIMNGTDFQKRVWSELLNIPYGKTVSYGDIARAIDNPKAVRAVGTTNGKNKIGIIIPCHRVIGSNGTLTGYAGGLWRKEWLLNHEKNIIKNIE